MSIATDKARVEGAKADLKGWLTTNGVTVPDGTLLDGLVDDLGVIDDTVATQTNLISQIQTALEGKAGGGGGVEVDTCTVDIDLHTNTSMGQVYFTYVNDDGKIISDWTVNQIDPRYSRVLCGSLLFMNYVIEHDWTIVNAEYLRGSFSQATYNLAPPAHGNLYRFAVFRLTAPKDGIVTLHTYSDEPT